MKVSSRVKEQQGVRAISDKVKVKVSSCGDSEASTGQMVEIRAILVAEAT